MENDTKKPTIVFFDEYTLGGADLRRIKALGLAGPGKVRFQEAGCLERCGEGPVLVVYPEAVWYTYVDQTDIDEIIDEHLVNGRVVERLKLADHA